MLNTCSPCGVTGVLTILQSVLVEKSHSHSTHGLLRVVAATTISRSLPTILTAPKMNQINGCSGMSSLPSVRWRGTTLGRTSPQLFLVCSSGMKSVKRCVLYSQSVHNVQLLTTCRQDGLLPTMRPTMTRHSEN